MEDDGGWIWLVLVEEPLESLQDCLALLKKNALRSEEQQGVIQDKKTLSQAFTGLMDERLFKVLSG